MSKSDPGRRKKGRSCGLDLGDKRVGVSIEDELGMFAMPRGQLTAKPEKVFLAALVELVREESVGHIVVGLPLDMSGGEGERARQARKMAQAIANATRCSVELWDERLTTVQAHRALQENELRTKEHKKHVDEVAATFLLQSWLDSRPRKQS